MYRLHAWFPSLAAEIVRQAVENDDVFHSKSEAQVLDTQGDDMEG